MKEKIYKMQEQDLEVEITQIDYGYRTCNFNLKINNEIVQDDAQISIEKETKSSIKKIIMKDFIKEVKAAVAIKNADWEIESEYANKIIKLIK